MDDLERRAQAFINKGELNFHWAVNLAAFARQETTTLAAEVERLQGELAKLAEANLADLARMEKERDEAEVQLAARDKELAEAQALVKEWLCANCNTVYPGPPRKGFACIICPKCGGQCGPRTTMELRIARAALVAERARVLEAEFYREHVVSDEGSHELYCSGCDETIRRDDKFLGFTDPRHVFTPEQWLAQAERQLEEQLL